MEVRDIINEHDNLNDSEKEKLTKLLKKHESLFDGNLGKFDTEPVKLFFKKKCQVPYQKPYPMLKVHEDLIKTEVKRLCDLRVLERIERNSGFNGAPCLVQLKMNHTVCL